MTLIRSGLWLAALAVALQAQGDPGPSGVYLGAELGRVNLRIPGRTMEMEGIQFTQVKASADNAGIKGYGGYWITPHFGFEFGFASLGNADATFNYAVPPTETGTGVTKVAVSNTTLSLQVGQQMGRWLGFVRGGMQFWHLSYETTFRLSTGGNQLRTLDKNGNSFFYGAGAEWNLKGNWNLRLEGEVLKMDITDAKVISLGLSYTFKSPKG